MIILGIDPGTATSGFGLINVNGKGLEVIEWGLIETHKDGLKENRLQKIYEETEIRVNNDDLDLISVTDDILKDAHFVTIGYLCIKYNGEPKVMEPDEITEWRWFDLNNLPSPIYFPSAKVLENYKKKKLQEFIIFDIYNHLACYGISSYYGLSLFTG